VTKISAVIPDDVAAALKERARVEDRSVGAVVRRAVAEHVGQADRDIPIAASPPADEKDDDDR
jgi:predicted transcriptional regulator